ncbi:MAG: hypothetical protein ABI900_08665 [Betaproteobacteria bacterium]
MRTDTAHRPFDDHSEVFFEVPEPDLEQDLDQAVESQKRDNLLLGETMVHIGLLERHELAAVRSAQAGSADMAGSLLVAGAIRSRLGEILLNSRHISSSQLEAALTLQREGGGLLGEILLGQGWLDQETLDAALAIQAARAVA